MEIWRRTWQVWIRLAQFLGDWIGRFILTIFYFTVFLPFGLGTRLWGDPLRLRTHGISFWLERTTLDRKLEDARKMT